ncbi:hypothetical protein L2E82_32613 [Cichorium intybus]|uniref:Uncharacterized protein n=1 Tax=Cichorium intybus TaxID=13427 RepID=A0ACB9BGG8_CICIN|nr:hypothetical protein L2E82_32613 [Cichorium intybus]
MDHLRPNQRHHRRWSTAPTTPLLRPPLFEARLMGFHKLVRSKDLSNDISGEARDGESVAVLGASGFRKSTLIDALENQIPKGGLKRTEPTDLTDMMTEAMKKTGDGSVKD